MIFLMLIFYRKIGRPKDMKEFDSKNVKIEIILCKINAEKLKTIQY